eukprot:TRINITY_DN1858_c1_g1_i1.p1 TRINITY_DN1858_c1_g1~~TRINITY_DN1858_c1_g1_i1.p1  ORF type:complete len:712 (+),score=233.86 TRINITY_DN1858_c1_g1_i1:31-2166(+)
MPKQNKRTRKFLQKGGHKTKGIKKKSDKLSKKEEVKDVQENHEEENTAQEESKKKISPEVEQHMKELEELKSTQSEFFEFLAKQDADLLHFGQDEKDFVAEDEGEEEEEHEDAKGEELTLNLLESWMRAAPTSQKATRQIVKAFHIAAHANDPETEDKPKKEEMLFRFKILNGAVFNELIIYALKELPILFNKHLGIEDEAIIKGNVMPDKLGRWKKFKKMIKVYLKSAVHFFDNLAEPKMISFVLRQTEKMMYYFGPFPMLGRRFLKKLFELWGGSEETVRILAFLNIRQVAIQTPYPAINSVLKGAYLTYVRNAKFMNMKTQPIITFMSNCVAELYGIDFTASYQHAFVYVRQLGIHLRNSHASKREHHESVYNWQNINSISVWIRVLCAYPKQEELWLLAYPLVQILHGIISLVPTSRNYPLRCHCIKMLNQLVAARYMEPSTTPGEFSSRSVGDSGNFFINSGSFITEMLYSPVFNKKIKANSGKPPAYSYMLKMNEKLSETRFFVDNLIGEIHELILNYLTSFSRSISFPELVIPLKLAMKHYLKTAKFANQKIKVLLDVINSQSKLIQAERNLVNFGPNDSRVLSFMKNYAPLTPLEQYHKQYHTQKRAELAKRLEMRQKKKESKKEERAMGPDVGSDDGDDDVDGDGEDGEQFEFEDAVEGEDDFGLDDDDDGDDDGDDAGEGIMDEDADVGDDQVGDLDLEEF